MKRVRTTQAQLSLLEELKSVAEKLGIRVREERLLREVGYRVRSGGCRVREDAVILLERGLPAGLQIDVLVDELARYPLESIYLSPVARRLLEGARLPVVEPDGEKDQSAG